MGKSKMSNFSPTLMTASKSLMIFKGEALYCTLCLLVQIEIKGPRFKVRLLSFGALEKAGAKQIIGCAYVQQPLWLHGPQDHLHFEDLDPLCF